MTCKSDLNYCRWRGLQRERSLCNMIRKDTLVKKACLYHHNINNNRSLVLSWQYDTELQYKWINSTTWLCFLNKTLAEIKRFRLQENTSFSAPLRHWSVTLISCCTVCSSQYILYIATSSSVSIRNNIYIFLSVHIDANINVWFYNYQNLF